MVVHGATAWLLLWFMADTALVKQQYTPNLKWNMMQAREKNGQSPQIWVSVQRKQKCDDGKEEHDQALKHFMLEFAMRTYDYQRVVGCYWLSRNMCIECVWAASPPYHCKKTVTTATLVTKTVPVPRYTDWYMNKISYAHVCILMYSHLKGYRMCNVYPWATKDRKSVV